MQYRKFSELLSRARRENGKKLQDVANATGLSLAAIFQFEHGKSYPTHESLKKICSALNLDFDSALELMKQEKELIEKARLISSGPPKYPELRKALLFFYYEMPYDGVHHALESAMELELERFSVHPIEKQLLAELYKRLKIHHRFGPVDYFGTLPKEKLRKQIKDSKFEWWTASADFDRIRMNFSTKKGESENIGFAIGWQRIKKRRTK